MNRINQFILLFAFFSLHCLDIYAQEKTFSIFGDRNKVEAWLKEKHVPALGIGILNDGKLEEIRMYGELTPGTPAPYNAIFNVASLTKPVVAVLTMKLVSNGSWNLDESLSNYWVDPDIANDPRHKKITTRMVLSHQTGFKNWRFMESDNKLTIHFEPGTKNQYSGEGLEYLRRALERKFGRSLPELADSLLFSPLGMRDTYFAWNSKMDEMRFARWHDSSGIEKYKEYKKTSVNAADDLLTTIGDYGLFGAYVLNGAGLNKATFDQMVKPHVSTGGKLFMSLGWEVFPDLGKNKEHAIVHSGSDRGVNTLVILLPVTKKGLIIFMNGDEGYKLYERIIVELLALGKEMMEKTK